MDIKTVPITKPSHGFALLKELDLQRRTGTFCDCVIRLQLHPNQLFLAHKSVLAAFSPVFATLLPQHGSFMDFESPVLTPETLAVLLEYMYTGTLPPKSHDEPVLYAAFHLQMEQLYDALSCRRKEKETTDTVQNQTNRKSGFTEHTSLNKTPSSDISDNSSETSEQPPPSTPSYEVVPVICHHKTTGNDKFPLQNVCLDKTVNVENTRHVSESIKHPQIFHDNLSLVSFFESESLSKNGKMENSVNGIPSVVAEEIEKINISCKIRQFHSSGSQSTTAHHSNAENKDQCEHSGYTSSNHLSPEPECRKSANRCVSDVDNIKTFNTSESEKHVHIPGIVSDTLSDKKSYNTTDSENLFHAFSPHMAESHKNQANLYLENSCSTNTNNTKCEKRTKRTSDFNLWCKIGQYNAPTSEMLTVEKVTFGEESQKSTTDCCEFSKLRKDCVSVYQGHLRYHCLPESYDSYSDETCPGTDVDVKDSSKVLETIDKAEILLSTSEKLKAGSHNHLQTRRFQCSVPECEKAFSQRGSLNRHMRSHLGIRPYPCPLCTMTFSRQYRVTEHMRIHKRSCNHPP